MNDEIIKSLYQLMGFISQEIIKACQGDEKALNFAKRLCDKETDLLNSIIKLGTFAIKVKSVLPVSNDDFNIDKLTPTDKKLLKEYLTQLNLEDEDSK